MRHQNLVELHSLIQNCLTKMTNDSYASNNKYSFKLTWNKGTGTIQGRSNETINSYYVLRFYFIDKNESAVGNEVELFENYYPIKIDSTSEKQEEYAYKEFILNGTRSMYNIIYSAILSHKGKELVRPEDIKDTDITIDELKQDINVGSNNKIITEI